MSNSNITAANKAAVFVVLMSSLLVIDTTMAQVDIVESNPIIRPIGQTPGVAPVPGQSAAPTGPLDDLYLQVQTLQQQVQQQTGRIEELSYELKRLKQQRMDDYIDLDRRLSELGQGAGRPRNSVAENSDDLDQDSADNNSANINNTSTASSRDETAVYRAANDLISAREWDKAIAALQSYLSDFPNGRYESNAHYWMGELYFVKNDLPKARDAFERVISQYPTSTKIDASKLKLGRTYFQLGDKAKAKTLLEEVAASNSDSSRQAALFLRENF